MFLMALTGAYGQEAKVKSFQANPMDLGAAQFSRKDLHGNYCALIKVQLVADSADFKGPVIGPVEKRLGEYWVYVPAGSKFLKIYSTGFKPLMVEFPEKILSSVTYILDIDAPQRPVAAGPVAEPVRQAYLVVNVTPPTAVVKMNGEIYTPRDGRVTRLLRNGTYSYTVEASGYFPEERTVNIDGKKVVEDVVLRSSKPTLTVTVTTPGTQIYVNDEPRGKGRYEGEMMPGLYKIEGRREGYAPVSTTVDLSAGEKREVTLPALSAVYGNLNVEYEPEGAVITIDHKYAGLTPDIITNVPVGKHHVGISTFMHDYSYTDFDVEVKRGATVTLKGALKKSDYEIKRFKSEGKYGFKFGDKVLVAPKYDDASKYFSDGLGEVCLNGRWGFVDETGREVIPLKYDKVDGFYEGNGRVCLNNLWGKVDRNGREIIAPKYDVIYAFGSSNKVNQVILNGKYGLIDSLGREIIIPKYDYISGLNTYVDSGQPNVAEVSLNRLHGLIDENGRELIAPKYQDVYEQSYYNGEVSFKENDKWGYADRNGRVIVQPKYDGYVGIKFGARDYAKVESGGKYGLINRNGRELTPFIYDNIEILNDNIAKVEQNGKHGIVDRYGDVVITPKYDEMEDAWLDMNLFVKKDGKYGIVDKGTGRELLPPRYEEMEYWDVIMGSDGETDLIPVKRDGLWGFIDEAGNEVIPAKYDEVWSFSEGLSRVKKGDKCGYIDATGREVIPLKYSNAGAFSEGLAWAFENGKGGYINTDGSVAIPFGDYTTVWPFSEGLAAVRRAADNKVMFIDRTGRQAIDTLYDDGGRFGWVDGLYVQPGAAEVTLNGESFVIDHNGRRVEVYHTVSASASASVEIP